MHQATRRDKALGAARFLAVCAALLSTTTPASAQLGNLGYLTYGLGSNLLWPVRNMMYLPYNYLGQGYGLFYPTGSVLGRMTGVGLNNSNSYSGGSIPYANQGQQALQGSQPTVQQQYTDPEPVTEPRQRVRQVRAGRKHVQDQISYAHWADPQNVHTGQSVPRNPPEQGGPQVAAGTPAVAPDMPQAPPPVAPQRGGGSPIPSPTPPNPQMPPLPPRPELPPQAPTPIPLGRGPAPLAANFVSEVNNKYGGDISKALFDANTRGYAKALGLVDNESIFTADLSQQRVTLIKQVMSEPTLDPVSKLNTVKILLNSNPQSASR
jgi:hypothetical protein